MMCNADKPLYAGRDYRIKEGMGYPVPWSPLRTRVVSVLNVVRHRRLSAMYAVSFTESAPSGRPRKNVHGAIHQGIGESSRYRVVAFEELIPVTIIN